MSSTETSTRMKTENERISKIAAENTATPTGSHYDVLGVKPDATIEQIKKAYDELLPLIDPANNTEANAAENFKKLKEAMEIIGNAASRQLYDNSIQKPEENLANNDTEKNDDTAPKAAPANPLFKQKIAEGDDPMVQLMKEWMNMMVDKYEGNLEGAAKKQIKDLYNLVSDYVNDVQTPEPQPPSPNISNPPKPTPQTTQLNEEQIEAYKLLGLRNSKPVDPNVISLATNLKTEQLNSKIADCNDRIEALGVKFADAQEKLSSDYDNQEPPMSHESYLEKHAAINEQYKNGYDALKNEADGYRSQHAECIKARDTLVQTPSVAITPPPPTGDAEVPSLPVTKMTRGSDTQIFADDNEIEMTTFSSSQDDDDDDDLDLASGYDADDEDDLEHDAEREQQFQPK